MTTAFTITLDKLQQHQTDAKKLQVKLLSEMMDGVNGKKGIDEILDLSRWAGALGGLHEYVTRMVQAKQETLRLQGMEINVADDVPMDVVKNVMSIALARPTRVDEDESDNNDDDEGDEGDITIDVKS